MSVNVPSIARLIKDYQVIVATCILCFSLIYNGSESKFQLIQLSNGRYFQVDKHTGKIVQVCQVDPAFCYKWDGLMLSSEDEFFEAYLKKRKKEEGLN